MTNYSKRMLGTIVIATLAACGGGGSGSNSNSNSAQVLNGVMLDSPVEGLSYRTETQQGTTDSNGKFNYQSGETVTFTLYGTEIGSALAASVNTPLDLLAKGTLATYTVNILRLIQSLDMDNNLDNGIKLPTINFNKPLNFDKTTNAFATDSNVLELLALANNRTLVSAASALSHFQTTATSNTLVSDYSISLLGKKLTETITESRCPNQTSTIVTRFISETDIRMSSTDFISGTCTNRNEDTAYISVEAYRTSQFEVGDPYSCLPVCTFAKLNGFHEENDTDKIIERMGSHISGSNTIRYVFTVLNSSRTSVIERGISVGKIEPL